VPRAVSPTESGLCLADRRRLELCDIIALSRPHGGPVLFSACQTATGDERLSDAGHPYRSGNVVCGSRWSHLYDVSMRAYLHAHSGPSRTGISGVLVNVMLLSRNIRNDSYLLSAYCKVRRDRSRGKSWCAYRWQYWCNDDPTPLRGKLSIDLRSTATS
jgi:hypothetical protein